MPGPLSAVGHAVTHFDVRHISVFVDDYSRAGVAQNRILAELRQYFASRAERALVLHYIENLADVRRVLGHCAHRASAMNAGGFGPTADQGNVRPYDNVMWSDDGIRYLVDNDLIKAPSQQLLHGYRSVAGSASDCTPAVA